MAHSGGIRHLQWRFLALHATISILSPSSGLSALPLALLHPHAQEERRHRTIGRNHRLGLAVAASGVLPWVPPQVLIEDGDESFVYVVEDGKAILRAVKCASSRPRVRGVRPQAGETVIVGGTRKVDDGAAVTCKEAK